MLKQHATHPSGFVCAKKIVRSLAVQINWGHLHAPIRHSRRLANSIRERRKRVRAISVLNLFAQQHVEHWLRSTGKFAPLVLFSIR